MENHNTTNQIGPQTQLEKRVRGRPRGSGRGARRAQTQRPAATQEQVPDIVPGAPGPVSEPAPAAPIRSINPPVSRFTIVANALVYSRTVKGAVKTYRSEVFDAVFWPRQNNPVIDQAARLLFNLVLFPMLALEMRRRRQSPNSSAPRRASESPGRCGSSTLTCLYQYRTSRQVSRLPVK